MDDIDDLESFIAGIEQTAPQEDDSKHVKCDVCGTNLEEIDEVLVCPNCGAQATHILLEETEVFYDESGRPIMGQRGARVDGKSRKSKAENVDYGWSWSTDDAISHILNSQLEALDKAGLLPSFFRDAAINMWFAFWLEFIAPHIKDEYTDQDLIQIDAEQALKLRDIEVLVKMKDKVMIPLRLINQQGKCCVKRKPKSYIAMGVRYHPIEPALSSPSPTPSSDSEECEKAEPCKLESLDFGNYHEEESANFMHTDTLDAVADKIGNDTRNITKESVTILTLNRTLAFIEATARCLQNDDPLFASDLIRACNQRLIPFYGAFRVLPDGIKLNARDRLMFQKVRAPSPLQLTRAATLLIFKVYQKQLPKKFPIPNLDAILKRFIKDLNLPDELYNLMKGKISFMDFRPTRPLNFSPTLAKTFPQYDRWAFCVLIFHLKEIFHLGNNYVNRQKKEALRKSERHNENYFVFAQWLQQMSVRLRIILTYDPFVLLHPLSSVSHLQTTPQMLKYISTLMEDRPSTQLHADLYTTPDFDEVFRAELTEFLCREMPRPRSLPRLDEFLLADQEVDYSSNIKYPITSSLDRTKKYWINELTNLGEDRDLILKDFSNEKISTLSDVPKWTFEEELDNFSLTNRTKVSVDPSWPSALKLLLLVGSFVCVCQPSEMVEVMLRIEDRMYPRKRSRKREP